METQIFSDSFESFAAGVVPTNYVASAGTWTTRNVGIGATGGSISLGAQQATSDQNLSRPISGVGQPVSTYAHIKLGFTHRTHGLKTVKGARIGVGATGISAPGNCQLYFDFASNGKVQALHYNGSAATLLDVCDYNAESDYEIVVDADFTTRRYTLTVNGTTYAGTTAQTGGNGYVFQNNGGTTFGSFAVTNRSTVTSGTLYFDNIWAVGIVSDPATALLLTPPDPATGIVGEQSGLFTVSVPPGKTLSTTVNVSIAGNGLIVPTTIVLNSTTLSGTFRVTPSAAGNQSYSISNDGSLANPNPVSIAVSPAPSSALTVAYPKPKQVIRRLTWEADGTGGGGAIFVVGMYTGNPGSIQARWGTGGWVTIASNLPAVGNTPTAYVGVIPDQLVGTANVEVRSSSDPGIIITVNTVSIGEVVGYASQSDYDGRLSTLQVFYNSQFGAYFYNGAGAWTELVDPTSVSGQNQGSFMPIMGTYLVARFKCPVGFVGNSLGGTSSTQWQPGNQTGLYNNLKSRILAATGGTVGNAGILCVIYYQAQSDMPSTEITDFAAAKAARFNNLTTLAAAIKADFGCYMLLVKIQRCTNYPLLNQQAVWAGDDQAIATNTTTTKLCANLSSYSANDGTHIQSTANAYPISYDMAEGIAKALFPTTTGGGTTTTAIRSVVL